MSVENVHFASTAARGDFALAGLVEILLWLKHYIFSQCVISMAMKVVSSCPTFAEYVTIITNTWQPIKSDAKKIGQSETRPEQN